MPIRHYLCQPPVNQSEDDAVQHLLASVPATGDWLVLSNVGLPGRGQSRRGDIDIVLIGSDTVHCIEVKPWEDSFLANPDNRSVIDDAHRRTKAKSGRLHQLTRSQFPHLNHRATILATNIGITPPRPTSRVDGFPQTGDIIDIHQCARFFDADARPPLTPAELDDIATLVETGFHPSRCLITGPPARTTGPTQKDTSRRSRPRGAPVTPYLPPVLVVQTATDPSPALPVTQVVARPARRPNAGTKDTSRRSRPRGAPIVGYPPRTA